MSKNNQKRWAQLKDLHPTRTLPSRPDTHLQRHVGIDSLLFLTSSVDENTSMLGFILSSFGLFEYVLVYFPSLFFRLLLFSSLSIYCIKQQSTWKRTKERMQRRYKDRFPSLEIRVSGRFLCIVISFFVVPLLAMKS